MVTQTDLATNDNKETWMQMMSLVEHFSRAGIIIVHFCDACTDVGINALRDNLLTKF